MLVSFDKGRCLDMGLGALVFVGVCRGTSLCEGVVCMPLSQCHVAGMFDLYAIELSVNGLPRLSAPLLLGTCSMGTCSNPAASSGTPCDDSSPFSRRDACDGFGICLGQGLTAGGYQR